MRNLQIQILLAAIVFLLYLAPGCGVSSKVTRTANVTGPTSQPVTIEQDSAGVIAKATRTVIYGSDVWFNRLALVLAFIGVLVFARWQALKHGYCHQRARRLEAEKIWACPICGYTQQGKPLKCPYCEGRK